MEELVEQVILVAVQVAQVVPRAGLGAVVENCLVRRTVAVVCKDIADHREIADHRAADRKVMVARTVIAHKAVSVHKVGKAA